MSNELKLPYIATNFLHDKKLEIIGDRYQHPNLLEKIA
jgi:hypothetical protein